MRAAYYGPQRHSRRSRVAGMRGGAGGSFGPDSSAKTKPENVGYVYDQFGNIIADPSGVMQDAGYETQATDAAQEIGDNAVAAVKDGARMFWNGLQLIKWGAIAAVIIFALHEVNVFRGSRR